MRSSLYILVDSVVLNYESASILMILVGEVAARPLHILGSQHGLVVSFKTLVLIKSVT